VLQDILSIVSQQGLAAAVGAAACAVVAVLAAMWATRRLRRDVWCLETSLDNMSQGLTMFGPDGRLVLCNRRYLEMYGLSASVVKPGCTVGQLIDHRIATGSLTAEQAQLYANMRQAAIGEEKSLGNLFELPNGRSIVVTRRPLPGAGWVATHDDITERREAEAQVSYMTHYDAVTDLPNRALFRDRLDAALSRLRRDERLAVLHIDVDHFKNVNDTFGRSAGDQLLSLMAGRLRDCLRDTDVIARLGGDEFGVLQIGTRSSPDPATLARRVRDAMTSACELNGQSLPIDVTIGISIAPNDGNDPEQLLKKAEMANQGAKSEQRGSVRFFKPEMDARAKARHTMEIDLRKALASGEFELYYQPLMNLQRHEISSCEALLRWHHPTRGIILPDDFIPVAEEMNLIAPLGDWVLRTACKEAAAWPHDVKVAVNVSPVQFKEKALGLTIATALAASGLPAGRLEIEITEAALMRDDETTLTMLRQLRDMGVRIVMDDFGTGYSSLSYLLRFPFDKIKVDRSFVKDIAHNQNASAVVQAVTTLARSMKVVTVAEGVETEAQLEKARAFGCTEIQGYLFGAPQPAAQIARLLSQPRKAGSVA
jgi:diguanylate cyclase (GGDEF)-like protein